MPQKTLSLTHRAQPPAQATEGPPPLLLLLHGVGSNEDDLISLAPGLDPRFFIISARAPLTLGPRAFGWYRVEFTAAGLVYSPGEAAQGLRTAAHFRDEAVAAYGLDADRVYLMGFSQGAIMCLGVALTQPERIAGTVAMSGRLLPEVTEQASDPALLNHKPFLIVHGTRDTVLPIAYGREIRDRLTALPVALTYHEYPMAHEVTPDSLSDITRWLTARLGEKPGP